MKNFYFMFYFNLQLNYNNKYTNFLIYYKIYKDNMSASLIGSKVGRPLDMGNSDTENGTAGKRRCFGSFRPVSPQSSDSEGRSTPGGRSTPMEDFAVSLTSFRSDPSSTDGEAASPSALALRAAAFSISPSPAPKENLSIAQLALLYAAAAPPHASDSAVTCDEEEVKKGAAEGVAAVPAALSTTPPFLAELTSKIAGCSGLSFEDRMKRLVEIAKPILGPRGQEMGRGFEVIIRPETATTPKVAIQLIIKKGPYVSEIISERSFPKGKRSMEYYYIEGYQTIGTDLLTDNSPKVLKIRLSLFNGEIVSVRGTDMVSGKNITSLIRALSPLFKGIEMMYLFDDAKKEFPGLKKESQGEVPLVWIKAGAICDAGGKTFYERELGVTAAKVTDWHLLKPGYDKKLVFSQDPEKYRKSIAYFANIKMRDIYPFMKKYPPSTGRIDRVGKKVFKEFTFGETDHSLKEIYSRLLEHSRGEFTVTKKKRPPTLKEISSAQQNLVFAHNSLFIPWETEKRDRTEVCEGESLYLTHLRTLVGNRIYQFVT